MSVSHFETGHRFPNAESLRRLADALGVSADYLLGRVKKPTGEDLEAADPEIAALFRRFQGMSAYIGNPIVVQATLFVSPDWTHGTFLGYSAFLERMRTTLVFTPPGAERSRPCSRSADPAWASQRSWPRKSSWS